MRSNKTWIQIFCTIAFTLVSTAGWAADDKRIGDVEYKPYVGQPGKDVIWVPTPDAMVDEMIRAAEVGPNDLVVDLGAGDGKIAIAAALKRGARAVGVEYDPSMAALARRNVLRAGVADKVTIIQGDLFKTDFSQATVVMMYLLPELNMRLKPVLKAMRPGTRIVSHSFGMESWIPDERIETANAAGNVWIVPVNAQGTWSFELAQGRRGTLTLKQVHQQLSGTLQLAGRSYAVEEGKVRGYGVSLKFKSAQGQTLSLNGQVIDKRLSGELMENGQRQLLDGTRSGS
jgi:SAM-dependent methyltransferase